MPITRPPHGRLWCVDAIRGNRRDEGFSHQPSRASRAPDQFRAWVAKTGVTVLSQTPSAFRSFEIADRSAPLPLELRHVVFGDEVLSNAVFHHGVHGTATLLRR